MRVYGGLKQEDWKHWGQFTTLKTNAAELAVRELRPNQIVYCSPLVDPYQPAERARPQMPQILRTLLDYSPGVFVVQTRGTLILRDLELLKAVHKVTKLRISFSITTDREDVRRRYEPHCESNQDRLAAVKDLQDAGLEVYATLAPLLPCNPERLVQLTLEASQCDLIGDPFHIRVTKGHGATTRAAAFDVAKKFEEPEWFSACFQQQIVERITKAARERGKNFTIGPGGFGLLARTAVSGPGASE